MRRVCSAALVLAMLLVGACRVRDRTPHRDSANGGSAITSARPSADSLARRDSIRRDSVNRASEYDPPCLASHLGLPCAS
jgi:hypothetical protein